MSAHAGVHQSRMHRSMSTNLLRYQCRMPCRLQPSCPLLLFARLPWQSTSCLRPSRVHGQPRLSIQFGLHQREMPRSMWLCWGCSVPRWQSYCNVQMSTRICWWSAYQMQFEYVFTSLKSPIDCAVNESMTYQLIKSCISLLQFWPT